jgi:hypothetical protein
MVTAFATRPSVPDRTTRAAPRTYHQLGAGAELPPLPGAVAHFQRAMMMDIDQAAKAMRDEEMLQEMEDFIEGFNQPTY